MKHITRTIIALIIFSLFANLFFFRIPTPLFMGLFFLGLCIFTIIVAEHRHKSMWILTITSIYAVGVLWMRATHFVQAQTILALFTATATLWYVSISETESFGSFTAVFLAPIFACLSYVRRAFSLMKPSILSSGYKKIVLQFGDRSAHSKRTSTLIGLTIAFPVTCILVLMFASADPIYYSYLKNILSPDFIQELPVRIFLSFLTICIITPLIFPKIRRVFLSPGNVLGRIRISHELTIVMAVISLVIASFIIIQWPYVFANVKAETDLSRYGVATYAEYVKKGFIELLQVSAFIYALLWIGLIAIRQKISEKSRALSFFQWIVMGEFLIILLSIARRVYLYQLYHGLTLIRVYGSFFLVWLACMALTLAGRHITRKVRFGYIEGMITIMLFIILGAWNVESFIVTIHPPTVNKRIDYIYLSRMSADGVNGWVKAYEHAKQIIEKYSKTSGEINKEGRREIAYADYILRRMTNQEYDYIFKYANPSEMKQYIHTIIDFQNTRLEKEKNELIEYKKLKPTELWVKDTLAEIEETKKEILKMKSQSLTDTSQNITVDTRYSDIYVDMSGQMQIQQFPETATPTILSYYTTTTNMYGTGNVVTRYAKTTALDRLYMQNVSDINAFQIMKQTMPLSQLHSLQVTYFELYNRIGKQAARDYEADISLDSPLL